RSSDTAAASRVPTGQSGMPSAVPRPCASAQATRREVKPPGPASKATPARSTGLQPAVAMSSEARGSMRAEWDCVTTSPASRNSGDGSLRRSATEAESPKTARARTGPFDGLAALVIGADCTERPQATRCRGRRRLALSPLAADFEGDRVLAQLLAQRPPFFAGQAGATQAGARHDRLGPHAGGGPAIGDV